MAKMTDSFRKPNGLWGKILLNRMNKHHDRLTRWALGFAEIGAGEQVLDVGCGGGNAIRLMAESGAFVTGVDYSQLAVEKSIKTNKKAVAEGRVEVFRGSVEKLPFATGAFDKATAFETIYFWPDLAQNFGEVLRVLKPGGRFFAVFEVPRELAAAMAYEMRIKGMRIPEPDKVKALFEGAGFTGVRVEKNGRKDWEDICVIGTKKEG